MDTKLMQHGMFSWFELMTEDVPKARDFYTGLLGWSAVEQDMGPAGMYTIFSNNGEQVAGLYNMPEKAKEMGAPPNWGSYITVADVDDIAAKAAEMGATIIVPPFDVPEVGRMCTIQDPTGAIISFAQYSQQS